VIVLIVGVSTLGPAEKSLGENVRLVYLHGAWVWTAIVGFIAAAIVGLAALIKRSDNLNSWSVALSRSGLFFWLTYLPLSLLTMRFNWNGLFLEEPRWRMAIDLAIVGILFQVALLLLQRQYLGSVINITYFLLLAWSLLRTDQVLHPSSPIASSGSGSIQFFFGALTLLCLLAGILLARWLRDRSRIATFK
jgi:hypothetical protein